MKCAHFRFYAELNDFLGPEQQGHELLHDFLMPASAKDMIESLGVPHTEIDLLLINGEPAGFARIVENGDHVAAYPHFRSLDISRESIVRQAPLSEPKFVLDTHLGRLARYLRMVGFDTVYRNDYSDEELALISAREHRILLTMDRGLLKRGIVTHGYYVRSREPRTQLGEVLRRHELFNRVASFTRCLECNGQLQAVSKTAVLDRLPPHTCELQTEFWMCPCCCRVFWRGSHYERMRKFLDLVMTGT